MIHATMEEALDFIMRKTAISTDAATQLIRLPASRKIDELKDVLSSRREMLLSQAQILGDEFSNIAEVTSLQQFVERMKASFNQRNEIAHNPFCIVRTGTNEAYAALIIRGKQRRELRLHHIVAIRQRAIELHTHLTKILILLMRCRSF